MPMYAIIDVETTGLRAAIEKIIDLAIIIHDGEKIIDHYQSLINPERPIPANIFRLTGITNEMVRDAPKFWEIARDVVLLTQDKTFVAHNVNFDYSFIRKEFAELGYDYKRPKLCTVRMSRRLMPGKRSYSLGKLFDEMQWEIESRHRAYGDAKATALLFTHLLWLERAKTDEANGKGLSELDIIRDLPAKTGVYYFLNDQDDIIYIGKSKNIRSRVLSHFQDARTRRSRNMLEQIHHIDYELTGSELIALLKESHEIKTHKPPFNRKQRRKASDFAVAFYYDPPGYLRLKVESNKQQDNLLAVFSSYRKAREYLFHLCNRFHLCQKLCGLYESAGACFYYHVSQCNGACCGEESPESYNKRAAGAIESLSLKYSNFFIIEPGRHREEKAIVQVENNCYRGYGYTDTPLETDNLESLREFVHPFPDNQDVKQILRNHLRSGRSGEILPY